MRVALAVAEGIEDYNRIELAMVLADVDPLFYVGTTATRGDALAHRYAVAKGLVVELCFAPRGDRQERNRRMVEHADVLVVVGDDLDIADLVGQAELRGLPVHQG